MKCTDCGATLGEEQRKGAPCHKCGSLNRSLHIGSPASISTSIGGSSRISGTLTDANADNDETPGTLSVEFHDAPVGSSEATRAKHRLKALLIACEQLFESADLDDGTHVIVSSGRLSLVTGFVKRDRENLDSGTI